MDKAKNAKNEIKGLITGIQRFSIHDGPGIRTTVFLKGCPMRCFWCHNPETWKVKPEIQFFKEKCIGCGECAKVCPANAHVMQDGQHLFIRERCTACGKCPNACTTGALAMAGKWWKSDDVIRELVKDRKYYQNSEGGITLSGGEPFMQKEFVKEILGRIRQEGIHTAVETAAFCKWEDIQELLPTLDLVIMDIKVMDDNIHQKVTGVSNKQILDNALRLSKEKVHLIIRTPVIPGVNDNCEAIKEIADFIRLFPNLLDYELMPFHNMAQNKYDSLGIENLSLQLKPLSSEEIKMLTECAKI